MGERERESEWEKSGRERKKVRESERAGEERVG